MKCDSAKIKKASTWVMKTFKLLSMCRWGWGEGEGSTFRSCTSDFRFPPFPEWPPLNAPPVENITQWSKIDHCSNITASFPVSRLLYTQVPASPTLPPPKLVQCVISLFPRDLICDFVEAEKSFLTQPITLKFSWKLPITDRRHFYLSAEQNLFICTHLWHLLGWLFG